MREIDYYVPYKLEKTNHGVDGMDAKRWIVAEFSSLGKALKYLANRGHTVTHSGSKISEGMALKESFYHEKREKRHTMGAISYRIYENKPYIPVDPE